MKGFKYDVTDLCRECSHRGMWWNVTTSHDEAFEDVHYKCPNCGADYWVEGADS